MAQKKAFVCSSCGYDSTKWYGKCPECGEWNTFQEISVEGPVSSRGRTSSEYIPPQKIGGIKSVLESRIPTGLAEFDRVLGGRENEMGIVPGSVILLSGDPGVGKSTILLQLGLGLAQLGFKILYITGEESEGQVKLRAERIVDTKKKKSGDMLLLSTTSIEGALAAIEREKPHLVIVDSVQTLSSQSIPGLPGSVPQVRYATAQFVAVAKKFAIPHFLVGHVTKEGIVAGPMMLSHMVDTVLYLEGDKVSGTRILRAHKNRFGDTSEVGIFIMEEKGLIEVTDASGFFMDKDNGSVPGACFTVIMEGSRPLLIEVQGLVVPSSLSFPRRVSTGIPEKRLELLIAIMQKHAKLPLDRLDVFVNVVGGLRIQEPGVDLAVCLAVASSIRGKALPSTVALAEVGLLGEVKQISNLEKREKEAKKFGFNNILTVKSNRFLDKIIKEAL